MTIWGNHSATQYPDLFHAEVGGKNAAELVGDQDWLDEHLHPDRRQARRRDHRGPRLVVGRLGRVAPRSTTPATGLLGTAEGDWVSMAVRSDGSYGVPEGLISSFPVTTTDGDWSIVQGLEIDDFSRGRIDASVAELDEERDAVTRSRPASEPTQAAGTASGRPSCVGRPLGRGRRSSPRGRQRPPSTARIAASRTARRTASMPASRPGEHQPSGSRDDQRHGDQPRRRAPVAARDDASATAGRRRRARAGRTRHRSSTGSGAAAACSGDELRRDRRRPTASPGAASVTRSGRRPAAELPLGDRRRCWSAASRGSSARRRRGWGDPAGHLGHVGGDVAGDLAVDPAMTPDVEHGRAGLDHVGGDDAGHAGRGDDDVGAAHLRRRGRGCRCGTA